MYQLQESALDVDAGVDLRCGMHVHLGWAPNDPGMLEDQPTDWVREQTLTMAWLGLEPLLWEHVAGSVWARRRSSNQLVSANMIISMQTDPGLWDGRYPCDESRLHELGVAFNRRWMKRFLEKAEMMRWDRHADLARAGHGGFYEFRIFNASRSAWRTELACRLSVAMSKQEVMAEFADRFDEWLWDDDLVERSRRLALLVQGGRSGDLTSTQRRNGINPSIDENWPITLDVLMEVFRGADERLGDLLDKQVAYQGARRLSDMPRLAGLVISNDVGDIPGHDRVKEILGIGA
jgi:hypothetical protein